MKKGVIKILIFALVLSFGFMSFAPLIYVGAQNQGGSGVTGAQVQTPNDNQGSGGLISFLGFGKLIDLLNVGVAIIVHDVGMAVAGSILAGAGYILDISIRLTLNIKDFVEATPEIYIIWKIIRDITGLCFIFFLIYAAIQMMTGIGKGPSYGETIKNIVIAGILINFSFFITSVAIDTSNIVSQAIYNAMIPNSVTMKKLDGNLAEMVKNNGKSSISNVFMNSLRIQSIYDPKTNKLGASIGDPIKIVIIGVAGIIMMITTAISFMLASMAFIARLVILLFLLAFSALWFAGRIIPSLGKHVAKFQDQLVAQLIFMPVYLLLMYVALRIINGGKIFSTGMDNIITNGSTWMMSFIILFVNFAIVIFILNLPLAVGLSMGGMATDWMKKMRDRFDAINVWKNIGVSARSGAWKNTGGRLASKLAEQEGFKDWASKSKTGAILFKGVGLSAESYNKKLQKQVASRTAMAESLGYDKKRVQFHETEIKDLKTQQAVLRSRGDKAGAKALDNRIRELESMVVNVKQERKANYAKTINTGSPETLWMKVARKNKEAAGKILEGAIKPRLEKANKELESVRESIKSMNESLERLRIKVIDQGDHEEPSQARERGEIEAKMPGMLIKEKEAFDKVRALEEQLP